jgi:hypothetical protein
MIKKTSTRNTPQWIQKMHVYAKLREAYFVITLFIGSNNSASVFLRPSIVS